MKYQEKIAIFSNLEFPSFISWRGNMVNPTFKKLHNHSVQIETTYFLPSKVTLKFMGKGTYTN
jgi:hypothetical protein